MFLNNSWMIQSVQIVERQQLIDVLDAKTNGIALEIVKLDHGKDISHFAT